MTLIAPIKSILFIAIVLFLSSGCTTEPSLKESPLQMGNPASIHCVKNGGHLFIEKNAAGGEYGVCLFDDKLQCEEWALFRGDCPVGGLKITGHATEVARYCIIRGGNYKITSNQTVEQPEQGTCLLTDGRFCDAHKLYSGGC